MSSQINWIPSSSTYESDLVLNSSIVRLRPLKQALKKSELKLEAISDFVPEFASIASIDGGIVDTKLLVMVSYGAKRPYSHVEGLANVYPVPRDFM